MTVLIDTNVILDMLGKREPWDKEASALLFLAAQGRLHAFISGSTATDLYYLMNRNVFRDPQRSKEVMRSLLEFFSVLPIGYEECLLALDSPVADYEDAVLTEAARKGRLECIITRNTEDFRNATVPIRTPAEYLSKMLVDAERC
jgi:predicted nucleic acid-binding protein